jgi:hypothetical protein
MSPNEQSPETIREQFREWEPIEGVPQELFLEVLRHDSNGLSSHLRSMGREEPTLEILFDSIVSYRNIDESFRLRTWTPWSRPLGFVGFGTKVAVCWTMWTWFIMRY